MNNFSSSETSSDRDEYPQVTQADLDRAKFRIDMKPLPRKQSITLSLDANLIEYFKLKAGESGYQNLINEILRQAKENEELAKVLR
jgi:uncharacterized protein (DUF4415 family)